MCSNLFKLLTSYAETMKNFKLGIAAIVLSATTLGSCIKHEVIPAPVPMVDLECFFDGFVGGIPLTLTQNVDGIYGLPEKAQNIVPAPNFSSERYFFTMKTNQNLRAVRIGLGSVFWDGAVDASPTTSQFNTFHLNNLTPAFSNGAISGCEVMYRDASGAEWVSKEASVNFQDVTFSNILQESDTLGDYSKFTSVFDCYVYKQDLVTLEWDSIRVQATEFRGWFKR